MAAKKLTTGRLIQILVVMSILITAFIWKTMNYYSDDNVKQCFLTRSKYAIVID